MTKMTESDTSLRTQLYHGKSEILTEIEGQRNERKICLIHGGIIFLSDRVPESGNADALHL